jgi:hypothetical protein
MKDDFHWVPLDGAPYDVSYEPVSHESGDNHGFVVLKGKPERLSDVREAEECESLAAVLSAINQPGNSYWSTVSDPGSGPKWTSDAPLYQAGFYVNVAFVDIGRNATRGAFAELALRMRPYLERAELPSEEDFGVRFYTRPTARSSGRSAATARDKRNGATWTPT